jgi:hypothetical protein
MVQRRIADYGAPIPASHIKSVLRAITPSKVLDGFRFSVASPNRMRISPGAAVTDVGVMILEDEAQTLTVTNSSLATNYTVYYLHNDVDVTGGLPATLVLEPGVLDPADISGVILGYIKYPGGAVPLSSVHFIQTEPVKLGSTLPNQYRTDTIFPYHSGAYFVRNQVGTIALTHEYEYTTGVSVNSFLRVRNTQTIGSATIELVFPYMIKENPFGRLLMGLSVDVNATMAVNIIDNSATYYTLNSLPLTGLSLQTLAFAIPNEAEQSSGSMFYVSLQVGLAAGKECKVQYLSLSDYNLPY